MSLSNNFPAIAPSLNLDFANVKALDPRITFTRTTTATYYDGVTTAKAEENLFLQSEDFTTIWSSLRAVLTGSQTAPDGTSTAFKFQSVSGETLAPVISQTITVSSGLEYVISIHAKAGDRNFVRVLEYIQTGSAIASGFDLSTGTVAATGSGHTNSIVNLGGGWYRCIVKVTVDANRSASVNIYATESGTSNVVPDNQGYIDIWGAQVEQRSAVSSYTPTTTQPITNYIPVLQTAASGVARFDHNPTTGESLGLLVEEQRTNLCLQSEDFSTTWTTGNASITSNTIVAPDGTLTGDKLVENTASVGHILSQTSLAVAPTTTLTFTVYAKQGGRNFLLVRISNNGATTNYNYASFNLDTGTVDNSGNVNNATGVATSITPVGNGWYRCAISGTPDTGGTTSRVDLFPKDNSTNASAYQGDGYSGVFIWGAQLEAGAFPTSYIATTSASVTRNADAASMTGTNFSSWFNNAEGSFYHELNTPNDFAAFANFGASDGSTTNQIGVQLASNEQVRGIVKSSNTSSFAANLGNIPSGFYKVSMAYKFNDAAICLNNGAVTTDTSVDVPNNMNQISISGQGNSANGHIRKLAYYPLQVTDAQLQALTS